ncbi:MAG TPA: hypothetical protein PLE72_02110, partial [Azospira sp.]|nr:hypothetical protein [Azospira sp.]
MDDDVTERIELHLDAGFGSEVDGGEVAQQGEVGALCGRHRVGRGAGEREAEVAVLPAFYEETAIGALDGEALPGFSVFGPVDEDVGEGFLGGVVGFLPDVGGEVVGGVEGNIVVFDAALAVAVFDGVPAVA